MPSNRNFSLTNTVFLLGFGFFLSWTLGVQLITLTSSPFDFLYGVLAFSILAAILSARRHFVLCREDSLAIPRIKVTSIHLGAIAPHGWLLLAALGLVFSLSAGIQYKTSNYNYFWAGCLSVGALAIYFRGFFEKALHIEWSAAKEEKGLSVDIVFVIAVIVGSAFYILTSIPDADDSLFLNFAVGAKEERDAVFVKDTMLGLNGLEFIKSTYRLESYQLLTAIISDASGWSVLFVAHTVVPLLTYFWAASILTIVHRLLFPQNFAATLLLHAAVLVAIDGSLLSFGYHAIPRFIHGKAPFLVAMIPLMAMLSLLWLKKKSRPALFLLVGSTIISVGFTANAIYVAPLCVALIGLTFLVFGKQDRLRAFSLIFVAL